MGPGAAYPERSISPNHYYRPPRSSRSSASILTANRQHPATYQQQGPDSPTSENSTSSAGHSTFDGSSTKQRYSAERRPRRDLSLSSSSYYKEAGASVSDSTSSRASSSDDGVNSRGSSVNNNNNNTPLGPRWGDYSFREADLFYGAPPPDSYRGAVLGGAGAGDKSPPLSPRLSTSSTRLWSKFTTSSQASSKKSFQVSRPALSRLGSADMNLRMASVEYPSPSEDKELEQGGGGGGGSGS